MKLYIIAGTYKEYRDYCWRNNVPLDGRAKYVSRPSDLRALRLNASQLRFTGSWRHRPDAAELEREAHNATSKMVQA